jgi:hypothetical protein
MPSTYDLIASTSVTSGTIADYTFSSIPQTYTDLELVVYVLKNTANSVGVQVGNGSVDTGSNYSQTILSGNGSTMNPLKDSGTYFYLMDNISYSTSQPAMSTVSFMSYANTNVQKMMHDISGGASVGTSINVARWNSTAAINTIKIDARGGGVFSAGTTMYLYGIKAA